MANTDDLADRLDKQADELIANHGQTWLAASVTMFEAAHQIRRIQSDANSRPYISAVSSDPDE